MTKRAKHITINGEDIPLKFDCYYPGELPQYKVDGHFVSGDNRSYECKLDDTRNLFVYWKGENPISAHVTKLGIDDFLFHSGLSNGNIWEWCSRWGVDVWPPEVYQNDDEDYDGKCAIWCVPPKVKLFPHWLRSAGKIIIYKNWSKADVALDTYFSARICTGEGTEYDDKRYVSYEAEAKL